MATTMFSPTLSGTPSGSTSQQWPAAQHPFIPPPGINTTLPFVNGANNMMMPPMAILPGFVQPMAAPAKRPIGSIDDDQVLVRAFRERNGRNYRQVLESLDMKNGYTAQQWKDYYLDHTPRLRRLITPPPPKPTIVLRAKAEESISQAPSKAATSKPKPTTTSKAAPLPRGYAYARTRTEAVPQAPSRSPTPPTLVIAGPRGNKFTDQDKDYFLRYVLWALKCDPSLTRQELCNNLEDKCPHHTAQSWNSYWRHHGEIADKAIERTRGEVSADSISSSSSDDEDFGSGNGNKKASASAHVRNTATSIRAAAATAPYSAPPRARGRAADVKVDQERMGPGGGSITTEDKRELARYIASHTASEWANKRQRFVPFHDKWSQRSAAAWAETYRRFPEEIDTSIAIFRSQAGNDWSTIWNPEREGDLPPAQHRVKVEEN